MATEGNVKNVSKYSCVNVGIRRLSALAAPMTLITRRELLIWTPLSPNLFSENLNLHRGKTS